jgi:hypothetical protein
LKPVQVKELSDAFDAISGKPSQTRYLRTQKPEVVQASDTLEDEPDADEDVSNDLPVPADSDPYAHAVPVDVLSKITDSNLDMLV